MNLNRFEGSSTGGRCAYRPVQAGLWGRPMFSPEASDQVSADRVSFLEDEVRAGQAHLTWLARFVQRLRTPFTSFQ